MNNQQKKTKYYYAQVDEIGSVITIMEFGRRLVEVDETTRAAAKNGKKHILNPGTDKISDAPELVISVQGADIFTDDSGQAAYRVQAWKELQLKLTIKNEQVGMVVPDVLLLANSEKPEHERVHKWKPGQPLVFEVPGRKTLRIVGPGVWSSRKIYVDVTENPDFPAATPAGEPPLPGPRPPDPGKPAA